MSSSNREIKSVSTSELYDQWAQVYDTDGNILQAVDDALFPTLLSYALTALMSRDNESGSSGITITELGCGTGRNTAKLLSKPRIQEIHALDLSPSMLALAEKRCSNLSSDNTATRPRLSFHQFDALNPNVELQASLQWKADLVISTLVLEHLPLETFFSNVYSLLREREDKPKSSYLVITNMHPDLGNKSRAGFTDPVSGVKMQGESYAHTISQVTDMAGRYGFTLVEVMEKTVKEADVGDEDEGKLLGPRGRKWIGVGVWFGMVFEAGPSVVDEQQEPEET